MNFAEAEELAKELNEVTYDADLGSEVLREAVRGVLELATDDEARSDPPGLSELRRKAWREGFEQAMVDIIDVIAQEFNVEPVYRQESSDEGGQR